MPSPDLTIETERMLLRPWAESDLEAFHAIWGDSEVIWWGASESLSATREGFDRLLARHVRWPRGVRWYAMVGKAGADEDDGGILGDVLLQPARFVPGIEIGWHLRRDAWGRGLATEAAVAVLARAWTETDLDRIYAIVAVQNERSLRMTKKLGLEPIRDMEYAGLPHRLFAIERPAG